MKAIYIKWLSTTSTKGIRLKASDNDGNSVTISRDYGLSFTQDCVRAAMSLCEKMDWPKDLIGNGDVFVFANEPRYQVNDLVEQ